MKKVLALTLAVVLAFGMMTVGFAAAGDRITGVNALGTSKITQDDGTTDLDNVVITSDNTFRIYLQNTDFAWKDVNGAAYTGPTDVMTTANLSGLSVKATWKKGGDFFNEPELKYDSSKKTCYIELKTKKGINITSDKDIDGKIVISYKSTKAELAIAGLAANTEEFVGEDDDAVWITKGEYIKPESFIKDLEVNFDSDDVVGHINAFGGKKYYFWIEEDVQSKDEELIAKYDGIENVYHAYYSSNVNVPSTYVTFDLEEVYYVYNQDGKYLGTTSEKLPLASTYYLASKKLDIVTDGEEDGTAPTDGTTPTDGNQTPVIGGDGDNAPNATDNPGTGSNGMMNIAVVAGVVALAAAAVSMKK